MPELAASEPTTVLVVDDDEVNLYLLRALLTTSGYRVIEAANGEEALEAARLEPPQLAISDILMPGMDGFALCRAWRQDPALGAIPFVFYTATYTDPKDETFALDLGADRFIPKPSEPEAFLRIVSEVLTEYQEGRWTDRSRRGPLSSAPFLQSHNRALFQKLGDKVAELERANEGLALKAMILDASVGAIGIGDAEGSCLEVNASFADMIGAAPRELIGQPLLGCIEADVVRGAVLSAVASRGSWQGEVQLRRRDGGVLIAQGIVQRLEDSTREFRRIMASWIDVTEQRRAEEHLQRMQRFESLDLFSRAIAHDVNNLLVGLFGNIELARLALGAGSPAQEFLDTAMKAFDRTRALTARLLTFAKGAAGARGPVDLVPVLRESCAIALAGSNIAWDIVPDGDVGAVHGDSNQLSQVFNNLILNARQAMPNGGTIHLFVGEQVVNAIEPGGPIPGTYARVAIQDEGAGVAPDLAEKIFDPFFTTKPNGTGLGLATSRSIVRDHSGHIGVCSRAGQGATFTVLLPMTARLAATPALPDEPVTSGRALVMDDDPLVRSAVTRMLMLSGYEVVGVENGEGVLDACARSVDRGERFDFIMLDVSVTSGMGGTETLVRLRELGSRIPIVLSSGYPSAALEALSARYENVLLLGKPYAREELLRCIRLARERQ